MAPFPGDWIYSAAMNDITQTEQPANGGGSAASGPASFDAPRTAEQPGPFVIGVALSSGGKINDYHCDGIDLRVGAPCVVEENGRQEYGEVALARRLQTCGCPKKRVRGKIVRGATAGDMERAAQNARKEKAAMAHCREKIADLDLRMSLSRVHYSFDGRKATFFFTADSRVDFRELVKELTNFTRVKVEMRQIGVRDEAKMLGGCGPCGQELCCSTFLNGFAPVSIRMAKDQQMSLSPEKISGVCGRLMCCLAYEHPMYKDLLKGSPKMGKAVVAPDGRKGKVCQINVLTEKVGVVFEDGVKIEYGMSEVTRPGAPVPQIKERPVEPPPAPEAADEQAVVEGAAVEEAPPRPKRKRRRKKRSQRPDQERSQAAESNAETGGRTRAERPPAERQPAEDAERTQTPERRKVRRNRRGRMRKRPSEEN